MPRSISDIREFIALAPRADIKTATVKKNGNVTKFKLRGERFVYTFTVTDPELCKKILPVFPPKLEVVTITNKAPKTAASF